MLLTRVNSLQAMNRLDAEIAFLPNSSFLNISRFLHLALYPTDQAECIAQHELGRNFMLVPLPTTANITPLNDAEDFRACSLEEIYRFDQMCRALSRQNAGTKIVLCSGADDQMQLRAAFLVGCHLIMTDGIAYEESNHTFQQLEDVFERVIPDFCIRSCWRAISSAKELGWINFREHFEAEYCDDDTIDMDEYLHYARAQNGEVFQVIPGKLLLFRSPCANLPPGLAWQDTGGTRRFSARFYADLFADMGVSFVMNLDGAHYDRRIFEDNPANPIQVCTYSDLDFSVPALHPGDSDNTDDGGGCARAPPPPAGPPSFQVLDRFISVVDRARGPVAVHCDGAGGGELACTLIAAYAIKRRFFAAPADAIAWLHMARPGRSAAAAAAIDLTMLTAGFDGLLSFPGGLGRTSLKRSHSVCCAVDSDEKGLLSDAADLLLHAAGGAGAGGRDGPAATTAPARPAFNVAASGGGASGGGFLPGLVFPAAARLAAAADAVGRGVGLAPPVAAAAAAWLAPPRADRSAGAAGRGQGDAGRAAWFKMSRSCPCFRTEGLLADESAV